MSGGRTYRTAGAAALRFAASGGRGRGFTLLELLTATAMFAVLVGAILSAFLGSLRLRENAYEAFESRLPRSYVLAAIKRDLAGVVPPVGLLAGAMTGEKQESGGMRRDRLEIHTASGAVSADTPWGDIQRIEYFLDEPEDAEDQTNPDSRDLVRAVTRNLLASTTQEPEQERLLSGVCALEFAYYDGENWQETWDSTTQEDETPSAVSVRIEFVGPEAGERQIAALETVVALVTRAVATEDETEASASGATAAAGPSGGTGGGGR